VDRLVFRYCRCCTDRRPTRDYRRSNAATTEKSIDAACCRDGGQLRVNWSGTVLSSASNVFPPLDRRLSFPVLRHRPCATGIEHNVIEKDPACCRLSLDISGFVGWSGCDSVTECCGHGTFAGLWKSLSWI